MIHAGWLVLFSFGGWHKSKPKKEKMVVVTKEYTQPKPITKVIKPVAIVKAAPPQPKKILAKKPAEKPVVKKKKSPNTSKQLLKKIDQTLTKIEKPASKPTPQIVTEIVSGPTTFFDRVCHIFQETLTLPEKGGVKLTISVQPNGSFSNHCKT